METCSFEEVAYSQIIPSLKPNSALNPFKK